MLARSSVGRSTSAAACFVLAAVTMAQMMHATVGQEPVIPHHQDRPPGPALSPEEAIAQMVVPEGFQVELVAAEPDLVNPVAMTFDERGRIWVAESLEYPRLEAGKGKDRIRILEDTDGDGRADEFTVFAEGLNIPSGIAVGYGGVWVANSPDLLLLQDTDGDDRADEREVIVTGFGRRDTHELPNSLTWGPDGWLYGLNGVFNPSAIVQHDRRYEFSCAVWRLHPRTRRFEVFAEGTSNPWGIAFDRAGSMFLSACVIDHLWHIVETGYYHRQAGAYPPFTWKVESIVDHTHQKAAYCGIHYFDSDVYPPEYRERLYMGNIHGGCINVDKLERRGATYHGTAERDFLAANDAWFMPVAQKTGPDGCLYVLDWYDRYHCYQDARRDPEGIDRGKGRLYRVRYGETPRVSGFDLAAEPDERLIELLGHPNVYMRDIAQQLLAERAEDATIDALEKLVLEEQTPAKQRMHALWTVLSSRDVGSEFLAALLTSPDPSLRAWGVRAAGNAGNIDSESRHKIVQLAWDDDPDVRLQVAIAAQKIEELPAAEVLLRVLAASNGDPLIPQIVWANLHPELGEDPQSVFSRLAREDVREASAVLALLPRMIDRLLGSDAPIDDVVLLVELLYRQQAVGALAGVLRNLTAKVQNGELQGERLADLRGKLEPLVSAFTDAKNRCAVYEAAKLLTLSWGDLSARDFAESIVSYPKFRNEMRLNALAALVAASHSDPDREQRLLALLERLAQREEARELMPSVLRVVAGLQSTEVATFVLSSYEHLAADAQAAAIELLTSRVEWALPLLEQIAAGDIPAAAVDVNQLRKLLAHEHDRVAERVNSLWGDIRTGRDPQREQVVAQVRQLVSQRAGDPDAGQAVFRRLCAQCHRIHGEGQEVGPDLTRNGRGSLEQLLSNVFDPSLVIGRDYRAMTVITDEGQVFTGLLVEDSPQRVMLKLAGGKLTAIARSEVDELVVARLSLMPEGIEQQLSDQEMVDLVAFLMADAPAAGERADAARDQQ